MFMTNQQGTVMKHTALILTALILASCQAIPQDGHRHVLRVESIREQDVPRNAPQRQLPDRYCPVGHHDNNWC
jgi:hypothetical protein